MPFVTNYFIIIFVYFKFHFLYQFSRYGGGVLDAQTSKHSNYLTFVFNIIVGFKHYAR